jgi:hypothetical protein
MVMRHKLALVLGSAFLAGSVLSAGYAQDQQQKPAQQTAPSGHDMTGPAMTPPMQGMSGNKEMIAHPEMMAQMQRMMTNNPEMAAQMVRMMENCNKMMESMLQHQTPATPAPGKKG